MLIRTDGAGATHAFIECLTAQRLSYSVGFTPPDISPNLLRRISEQVWTEAYDAHDTVHDGRGSPSSPNSSTCQPGQPGCGCSCARCNRTRRPLAVDDVDAMRITAFATNTRAGGPSTQLTDPELRHRHRARCEDRIWIAKDTGLTYLPLHSFAANQIWCPIVTLALDVTARMQSLALSGHHARRSEPKRIRLQLFTVPAAPARTGRRILLHSRPGHAGPRGHRRAPTTRPHRARLTPRRPSR
ncbi:transposase [Cellulomonas aerilata]